MFDRIHLRPTQINGCGRDTVVGVRAPLRLAVCTAGTATMPREVHTVVLTLVAEDGSLLSYSARIGRLTV